MALWTPLNLTTQPDWWFDAADTSTLTLNGSGVLNWEDKGTVGVDAYQTNPSAQPQLVPNVLNGKPIIRFESVGRDNLQFPSTRQLINKTIILVWKNNGGGSPLGISASRINAGAAINLFSTAIPYGGNGNYTTIRTIGTGFGIGHIGLHSTLEFYINGVKDPTNPTRVNTTEQWNYNSIVNLSFDWRADLAEIMVLPAEPSTEDRQKIEGYIAHKWGITSVLLPGHPYFSTAPVTELVVSVSIPNAPTGARYRISNQTQGNIEIENALVPSGGISTTFIADDDSVPHEEGDLIYIDLTYPVSTTAYLPSRIIGQVSTSTISGLVAQVDDEIYNFHGIDGSQLTKFTADFVEDDIQVAIAQNFLGAELYAYYVHILHSTQGIREWLNAVTAIDIANFRINTSIMPLLFDNETTDEVWQTDNVRIFRSDGARPIKNPTTGGGGVDIQWRSQVYTSIVSTASPVITGDISQIPSAVQTGMTAQGYTNARAIKIDDIKTKVDTLENTDLTLVAKTSELPTDYLREVDYIAPDNDSNEEIKRTTNKNLKITKFLYMNNQKKY